MLRTLLAATLVVAQQLPPQPTFRSVIDLVEVDVRVVDKDGRFVSTLTADDFELMEDGVDRTIDVVYLVSGGAATVMPARSASSDVRAVSAAASRQTWVFVFDVTHLSPAGLTRTRDAVRKFVHHGFREGDLGGVIGERGMVNDRFTSNREELANAVASVRMPTGRQQLAREMREWPRVRDEEEALQLAANDRNVLRAAMVRACHDDPTFCEVDSRRRGRSQEQVDDEIEMLLVEKARRIVTAMRTATLQTLGTLTALTRELGRVPGAKTVVLLSEGFVSEAIAAHIQDVTSRAGAAGARFYSIDARGLARGGAAEIMDGRWADSAIGALGSGRDLHADGMNALAIDSGGFAIRNENNFGRALDLVAADSGTFYVIGYRPASLAYDGTYRRIEVRVKQPGLRVRARRGYLAVPPARLLTAVDAPPATPADTTRSSVPATQTKSIAELPALPQIPHTAAVSGDVIRKVLELARDASALRREGNASAGWAAYQRGDVEAAASELRAAVAHGDNRPWVQYVLGFTMAARAGWKEAAQTWERVRAAAPEFEPVYFDLADAYLQGADPASALAVLRDAQTRWPSDADVYNAIGVVQVSRGALDDAVRTFERAVKSAPAESLGYFNLGRAYSLRFFKSQRYNAATATWVSSGRDRDLAVAQFQKYLALGGPYVQQAREALTALAWK